MSVANDNILLKDMELSENNVNRRFRSLENLYGTRSVEKLFSAHVLVVGLGGVGSWVVEALVRSAIGYLTLVDLDNVNIGNTNRQIHAMDGQYGKSKTHALGERAKLINPNISVREIEDFVTEENVEELIFGNRTADSDCFVHYDAVIDAIDDTRAKSSLVAACVQHGQFILTVGGAGGRVDPTKIIYADLSEVKNDPLLAAVRSRLRRIYGFPKGIGNLKNKFFNVPVIYSDENIKLNCQSNDNLVSKSGLSCVGLGSSVCVTASMGFAAAACALNRILRDSE